MSHRIPGHLSEGSKTWLEGLRDERTWSASEWRLLHLAAEAFDRAQTARRQYIREGMTLSVDKWQGSADRGQLVTEVKPHPAVAIARDSAATFSRLLAQLELDVRMAGAGDDEGEAPAAPVLSLVDALAAER